MRSFLVGVSLALLTSVVVGCEHPSGPITASHGGPSLTPSQTLATNASVRLSPIETGCWLLDTPQGSFLPIDLPTTFRIQGLPVHVVVRGDTLHASFCMMGPMVTLDSIRVGWQ